MKHLLSMSDLDRAGLDDLLTLSEDFLQVTERDIPKVPALQGKVVVSLFYEDSTRTRISFETAAKRLSCDVMSFSVGSSSVNKGEGLRDTVQTIAAMAIALDVRIAAEGVESEGQLARLAAFGCDEWQGHHYSAPLDAAGFERLFTDKIALAG